MAEVKSESVSVRKCNIFCWCRKLKLSFWVHFFICMHPQCIGQKMRASGCSSSERGKKKEETETLDFFLLFAMGSAGILDTPISAARHVVLSGSTKAADGELMERLLQGVEPKEGNIRHNWSHKNTFVGFLFFFFTLSLPSPPPTRCRYSDCSVAG